MMMGYAFTPYYLKNKTKQNEEFVSDTMNFLLTLNWQCKVTDKYISHLV